MKTPLIRKESFSYKSHQRQFTWQILVPLLFFLLMMLVVSGFTLTVSAGQASLWADIALIWLLIPVIFGSLLLLTFLVGMVYLMTRLLQISPTYTAKAQHFVWQVQHSARQVMDGAVKPVILIKSIIAGVNQIFKGS